MMNIQKMTNEQLCGTLFQQLSYSKVATEIQRRLCAPKQPYQIKYKFLPNNRDIDDMKALTVWGTSPLAACQTLVDANDWRGQSIEFQVNEYHFTSDDLE
jgi:hypothetical protein